MFDLQWGFEYQTCADLEWSKAVGLENVRFFWTPFCILMYWFCFEAFALVPIISKLSLYNTNV